MLTIQSLKEAIVTFCKHWDIRERLEQFGRGRFISGKAGNDLAPPKIPSQFPPGAILPSSDIKLKCSIVVTH